MTEGEVCNDGKGVDCRAAKAPRNDGAMNVRNDGLNGGETSDNNRSVKSQQVFFDNLRICVRQQQQKR
jgi:hypothetical protein